MKIVIHFESSVPRRTVALHAWEPRGKVWDVTERYSEGTTQFRFFLEGTVADQRTVHFKFRFPDERRWEGDEYLRVIPTRRATRFWAFDYSARVTSTDPTTRAAPTAISVQLITRRRLVGGRLYAWRPGAAQHSWNPETRRDAERDVSHFQVPVEGWMRQGFHFKFVDQGGTFEPDQSNRVWRPVDGDAISVKSGQATLWVGAAERKPVTIRLIYPNSVGAAPTLRLVDESGDACEPTATAISAPVPLREDPRFLRADYATELYPEAMYTVGARDPALEGGLRRPLRAHPADEGPELERLCVLGDERWLTAVPARASVRLIFHPRPWTPELARLAFDLAIGAGPTFDRIAAVRSLDGSWRAETLVWVGVALSATPIADQPLDQRPDGPVSCRRGFALSQAVPLELHTADAQLGFVQRTGTSPFQPEATP